MSLVNIYGYDLEGVKATNALRFSPEEEDRFLLLHRQLADFNDEGGPEPKFQDEPEYVRFRQWQGLQMAKTDPRVLDETPAPQ